MLDAFWSGLGSELAKTWVARVLTPAFAFWAGGALLLWWRQFAPDVTDKGWTAALEATGKSFASLPIIFQITLIIAGLLIVASSAVIADRLTLPVLRLLEGYWPPALRPPFVGPRRKYVARVRRRHDRLVGLQARRGLDLADHAERLRLTRKADRTPDEQARLTALEKRSVTTLSPRDAALLASDTARLDTTPDDPIDVMPTRLGDVLRSSERRPGRSYGIDAVICWPALWLTLPAETRTALLEARAALDAAARAWLWGALFLIWTPLNPWAAVIIGIGVPVLAYRFAILPRALTFGSLVATAYDLHRVALYDALHLPRPISPEQERSTAGPRLTLALAGHLSGHTSYRFPPPPARPGS